MSDFLEQFEGKLVELCPECHGAGCLACDISGVVLHDCEAETKVAAD